jgi:hypothetical protein
MKDYNKILRTGLAAIFMGAAANSALADDPENNAYVESVLAGQEQSTPHQAQPGNLAFVYKESTLDPANGSAVPWFIDWQKRVNSEAPLPKTDHVSVTYTGYPVLNGQNIGQDFNKVRNFISQLADQGVKRAELLNVIAAYSADLSRKYYKEDSAENDLIMRPEIYGDDNDWETLREVIKENGDDCDGLAMLTRQLMTDIGIPKDETYLVYMRPLLKEQIVHMVAMWVDPAHPHDPLLIDSTGYISDQPYRSSWVYAEGGEHGKYFATNRMNEYGMDHVSQIPSPMPNKAPSGPTSKR